MNPQKRTPEEVAQIIDRFLDGTGGDWDWGDFCSIKITDPELDQVREFCLFANSEYPPTEKGHYCNSEGFNRLREVARNLRAHKRPAIP